MSKTDLYTQGAYLGNHPSWLVEDSPWKAKQILRMLKQQNLQIRSICEVGCGAGEILRQLYLQLEQNVVFTGYEISPQAFELCKQRSGDRLTFLLEDLLDNSDAHFDLALCLDVFEHIPDYLGFLEKFKDKADYKMFHIPLDMSVSTVLRGEILMKSWSKSGHIHFFTKDLALAALQDTGYEIIEWFYTAYYAECSTSIKSRAMSVPRAILHSLNPDLAVRILGGYELMVLAK
jgi:SAM-dependent methyltransferase